MGGKIDEPHRRRVGNGEHRTVKSALCPLRSLGLSLKPDMVLQFGMAGSHFHLMGRSITEREKIAPVLRLGVYSIAGLADGDTDLLRCPSLIPEL
nr:hypothetical protein [Rhizobium lusitanum]